jgi:hypothetical protein
MLNTWFNLALIARNHAKRRHTIMASVKALAKKRAEQEGRSLSNYLEQLVLRDAGSMA